MIYSRALERFISEEDAKQVFLEFKSKQATNPNLSHTRIYEQLHSELGIAVNRLHEIVEGFAFPGVGNASSEEAQVLWEAQPWYPAEDLPTLQEVRASAERAWASIRRAREARLNSSWDSVVLRLSKHPRRERRREAA